jgi:phosphonate transport system ATP-binding protein
LTFVCSLHQVDIALEYFSRIIGIKEASIVFDLAPEQVTDETMRKVYER